MAITAVLAAAQTLVILTRNIDLSVGSIVGVTAYLTGEYLAAHQTTAPLLAVALAMLLGLRPWTPERHAGGLRAGAGDHRHPRDAGDLPDLADRPRGVAHHHGRLAAHVAGGIPATDRDEPRRPGHPPGAGGGGAGDPGTPGRAWQAPLGPLGLRRRLQPRRGPAGRPAGGAHHPWGVRHVRRPVGAGGLHVPVPVRDHHGGRRPRPGARLGRRGRRRRGQHPRRLGHPGRGAAGSAAHRPPRAEPGAGARGQRVLA
jgi:hypothetical protein